MSKSKPLLEHNISILGVWVNNVIILKGIILYNQKQSDKGHVLGKPLVVSLI